MSPHHDRSNPALVTVTIAQPGEPCKLRLRVAALRVLQGPDAGAEVRVAADPVTIGCHASCDLPLTDQTVSGRHAEIVLRPAGYLLRDLGSKNGLYVNGLQAERIFLVPGAQIRLGQTTLGVLDSGRTEELDVSGASSFGGVIGRSLPMRRLFASLEAAAGSETTVLLEGETGTGKGALAEALHHQSRRADGPFEVFDCAAVQPSLIESELFGHERGAFTGATATHRGAVERADGGTLLIDEVGELPLELQTRLLRLLETRALRRVGGAGGRKVSVRYVAATNRRLDGEVARGAFRKDLYYRLAVLRLVVPPLRERAEDLPSLVDHLARGLDPSAQSPVDRFQGLIPLMATYDWPGNVRELRNVVERLALMAPADALPTPLQPAVAGRAAELGPYAEARDRAIERFERVYVLDLLRHSEGNVTRAAELAGVSRRYLTRLIARHEIDRRAASRKPER